MTITIKDSGIDFSKYMKDESDHKGHALYSPSGMERILGCPGSVRLTKDIPRKPNEYSTRGVHAHTLLELMLREGMKGIKALQHRDAIEFKRHIQYTSEMHQAVRVAYEFIIGEKNRMKLRNGVEPTLLIERKVRLSDIVGADCSGTSDTFLYQLFGVLHVVDYKNGTGVVDPAENAQMMTYALGLLHELGWDFREVWMTIIQPNAKTLNKVRTWKTTIERMEAFERELKAGIARTKKRDAPFVVSPKWCFFCSGKDICPAQQDDKHNKVMSKFQRGKQ